MSARTLHDHLARGLHLFDGETAHQLSLLGLGLGLGPAAPAGRSPALSPTLATTVAGLTFANPVGLAPGYDKDARVPLALLKCGFGFVECGTVTPLPQVGNPKPRLFRLSQDEGVINRMGFNNGGLEAFAARLPAHRPGPVGANIGANKDSADRIGDYVVGLTRLWGLCDYFTLNISSPNTPGLRALQTQAALEELLTRVGEARAQLTAARPLGRLPPLFLKVAPDLEADEIGAITEAVVARGVEGIVVGNTTLDRPDHLQSSARTESGGLSGRPLAPKAFATLKAFAKIKPDGLILIAAGGICDGDMAYERIRAGASLVQLYSALVYEGPGLVDRITARLAECLRRDGFDRIDQAVGADLGAEASGNSQPSLPCGSR